MIYALVISMGYWIFMAVNRACSNFHMPFLFKSLTCLFNSLRLSWMLRIDWNTGLSKTEMRALRSAPTCLLFLRSSVWRTLVCTSFRSSNAARVSLEIGILISLWKILPNQKGPGVASSTWADRCPWCCFSSLLLWAFLLLCTVHHYFYFTVDCIRQVDSAFGNSSNSHWRFELPQSRIPLSATERF